MPFNQKTSNTERLFPPDYLPGIRQGDWVDISIIYNGAIRKQAHSVSRMPEDPAQVDVFAYREAVLQQVVLSTSDGEVPDVSTWHPALQDWVANEFYRLAGRSEAEKKESKSGSTDGLAPAEMAAG